MRDADDKTSEGGEEMNYRAVEDERSGQPNGHEF